MPKASGARELQAQSAAPMLGPFVLPLINIEDIWSAWDAPQAATLRQLCALPEASLFTKCCTQHLAAFAERPEQEAPDEVQLRHHLPSP